MVVCCDPLQLVVSQINIETKLTPGSLTPVRSFSRLYHNVHQGEVRQTRLFVATSASNLCLDVGSVD